MNNMNNIYDYTKYLLNESFNSNDIIPEIKLMRTDGFGKDLKHFRYPDDENIGNRNKLGGVPDWIQNDETPKCPHCKNKMVFYGQLDSINSDYNIMDCGIIYVFYCPDCGDAKAIVQTY